MPGGASQGSFESDAGQFTTVLRPADGDVRASVEHRGRRSLPIEPLTSHLWYARRKAAEKIFNKQNYPTWPTASPASLSARAMELCNVVRPPSESRRPHVMLTVCVGNGFLDN